MGTADRPYIKYNGNCNYSIIMYTSNWIPFPVFYAACLREYGNEWHLDGKLDKKQNCFDDLHAAAEYLIENGYTSNKKSKINGIF